jgi:hypothetical protein
MRIPLLALAAAAALAAPPRAAAGDPPRPVTVSPLLGAWLATGGGRDALEDAPLTGAQAVWDLDPRLALVGTVTWAPTRAKALDRARLDLLQYDLGLRAQHALAAGGGVTLRPFLGTGFGARTIHFHDGRHQEETGFAWYLSGGAELGWRALSTALTARHQLHSPNGSALGDDVRRDVALFATAGLRL